MEAKSVIINQKHMWKDWGLHLVKIEVGPPEVNDVYVSVPYGKDLDLSEVNGMVSYKKRVIRMELGALKNKNAWRTFLSQFMNAYHGKKVELILETDRAFYYTGRAYIKKDIERTARIGRFEMEIIADPYKYEQGSSQEPWKWDLLNFPYGSIRYIGELTISGAGKEIRIPKGDIASVPVFYAVQAENLRVVYKGKEYALRNGRNRYPQILVSGESEVVLSFKGAGRVTIDYRGRSL